MFVLINLGVRCEGASRRIQCPVEVGFPVVDRLGAIYVVESGHGAEREAVWSSAEDGPFTNKGRRILAEVSLSVKGPLISPYV